MCDSASRSFSTKSEEFTVCIQADKFPEGSDQPGPKKLENDRRFNIRIRQDDINLLDALAKKQGTTRSALINNLIHEIMLDELMSIEEQDARTYLANFADQLASYDDIAPFWAFDALRPEFRFVLRNVLEGCDTMSGQPPYMRFGDDCTEKDYRTPAFMGLREKLEGLVK